MTTRTNTSLRTFFLASICCTLLSSVAKADDEFVAQEKRELMKLSPSLAKVAGQNATKGSDRRVISLLTFSDSDQSSSMLDEYGCQVVDSIGRIFIVKIPYSSLADMAADARIERIEAERMPRPAMDVTPQQINATQIYIGESLPQAFTGRGVIAGVFDNGFDFTHPAFLDADLRIDISQCRTGVQIYLRPGRERRQALRGELLQRRKLCHRAATEARRSMEGKPTITRHKAAPRWPHPL